MTVIKRSVNASRVAAFSAVTNYPAASSLCLILRSMQIENQPHQTRKCFGGSAEPSPKWAFQNLLTEFQN